MDLLESGKLRPTGRERCPTDSGLREKKGSMMRHPKIIDNPIVDKMLKVTPGSHIATGCGE
jgi:hypothetical protein